MKDSPPALSVVIPLFNEADVLPVLARRLVAVLEAIPGEVEVLLVDDGSRDSTRARAVRLCEEDARFRLLGLSRNFGHQAAISAGMEHARGSAVAVMDADLQDPPEMLPGMLARLSEGHAIVYGIRASRAEGPLKSSCYWIFYRLLRALAEVDIPADAGDFCVMSRVAVDAVNALPERHRFLRGLRSWVGFSSVGIPYDRPARAGGAPKYTTLRLLSLAAEGIFTFSRIPLRLAAILGAIVFVLALLAAMAIVVWRLSPLGIGADLPGYASLFVGVTLLGGLQMMFLGVMGEYLGRIYDEVKRRPPYIVEMRCGGAGSPREAARITVG